MLAGPADAALVAAAQEGDRGALAELVERHRATLLALCRRALGDAALAEDAAQEAVVQAMFSLASLRRPERFGAWLCGIGLNVCRRWLRDSRSPTCCSWEALLGGTPGAEPPADEPGPAELAEAAELVAAVRRAVAELPPGQRAAVLLFYLSGLTYAETAAQLGVEVGAVRTRLHKARGALRRRLRPLWEPARSREAGKGETMATETSGAAASPEPREVRVVDVRRVPAQGERPRMHVVLLEEAAGGRRLPIWIGQAEGEYMALQLVKTPLPRPPTYAFTASLLAAVGARLLEVQITRLTDNVFYAAAVVAGPAGVAQVDARPSDAINLALAVGATIRVESAVFDAAAAAPAAGPAPSDPFAEGTAGSAEIAAELRANWPSAPAPSGP